MTGCREVAGIFGQVVEDARRERALSHELAETGVVANVNCALRLHGTRVVGQPAGAAAGACRSATYLHASFLTVFRVAPAAGERPLPPVLSRPGQVGAQPGC